MKKHIKKAFEELVILKYRLYNSLFLTLKFDAIDKTGDLLPILQKHCRKGLEKEKSPLNIIDDFFNIYRPAYTEKDKIAFMFNVIQYVERQIVLVDALEESAYKEIHDIEGPNTWLNMLNKTKELQKDDDLKELIAEFGIRLVLTAHPTQFYPNRVLNIINDLNEAITKNDLSVIRDLLKQLGKTPFLNKEKPDPYTEALSLVDYLTDTFYPAAGELIDNIADSFDTTDLKIDDLINLGFWPGGDRDGNPFVTTKTTLKIANKLRKTILDCYYEDIKRLKRRLSFAGIYECLSNLEEMLYSELTNEQTPNNINLNYFLNELKAIEKKLITDHRGLFVDKLRSFIRKVEIFGFYLASIDIRQDSRMIRKSFDDIMAKYPEIYPGNIFQLPVEEQIEILLNAQGDVESSEFDDPITLDTIGSIRAMMEIQSMNGENGCHRYIISNCRGPVDVAIIMSIMKLCAWKETDAKVDIVPLFETINDLKRANDTMCRLYENAEYRKHLVNRNNNQTVMLGFSDGTKDGGYLTANWSIFKAKEEITAISRKNDVKVAFFDGRGGPPARGGGSTHLFYSALGSGIESRQIQLTVQGQTINSQYGTILSAKHNLENLITAGLENNLFNKTEHELTSEQRKLFDAISECSFKAYSDFRNHPLFMPYLNQKSTLKYYGKTNIGSRPVKRNSDKDFKFEDLRAIPFVGAWSQLKQNIPGFFGLGTALNDQEESGNFEEIVALYNKSVFFRTLISNSMQSMSKTYFPLTYYMKKDEKFGKFWKIIFDEYKLSQKMIRKLTGTKKFLKENPRSRLSIKLREEIVLPLLTIQQYALIKIENIQQKAQESDLLETYEKIAIRTLFGNINASRNSV
jgi:phosphoenolpyruvate carboxylase